MNGTTQESEALIVLNGWDAPVPSPTAHQSRDALLGILELANLAAKIGNQAAADNAKEAIAQAKLWMDELEKVSKALREPYFNHAKAIKRTSDEFMAQVAMATTELTDKLGEFEKEKIRVREALERQAAEEAERLRKEEEERQRKAEQERQKAEQEEIDRLAKLQADAEAARGKKAKQEAESRLAEEQRKQEEAAAERQQQQEEEAARLAAIAPAPVAYQPERTEGTNVSVQLEYDIVNPRAFAQWCWATGKDEWVREIAFERRSVMGWLNVQPKDGVPIVPGLAIRRVVGVAVQKAKKPKIINVAATKVAL